MKSEQKGVMEIITPESMMMGKDKPQEKRKSQENFPEASEQVEPPHGRHEPSQQA